MNTNEYVFIVPYDKTVDIDNGFTRQKHTKSIWNKYNDVGEYVQKDIADNSIAMQQITPVIIIRNSEGKFFSMSYKGPYKNIISICFSDNLIPDDGIYEPLFKGAFRLLFKQVKLENLSPFKYIGTVRDMEKLPNYLGYVFLLDNIDKISLNNDILEASWLTKEELIEKYGKLCAFSKHITNYLVDNSL